MPIFWEAVALNTVHNNPRKLESDLRAELAEAGVNWRSLKQNLPDWVESAFESGSGVAELKTFLARNIGLQIDRSGTLRPKQLPPACFKTNTATRVENVMAARSLATACARLVAKATARPYRKFPSKASELRGSILQGTESRWIDLPALLSACWDHGIPVLYMPSLPVEGRKMEGMVTFVCDRPVIVLTKRVPHPDWLLFLLAHEIGHSAKGHLIESEGEAIVDDTVEISTNGDRDQQEAEANRFATHLLAPNGRETRLLRFPDARTLAANATKYGAENGMAPGYVILNAVHNHPKKPYGLAQNALKMLDSAGGKSAAEICRDQLRSNIEIDRLRSDSADFVEKIGLL